MKAITLTKDCQFDNRIKVKKDLDGKNSICVGSDKETALYFPFGSREPKLTTRKDRKYITENLMLYYERNEAKIVNANGYIDPKRESVLFLIEGHRVISNGHLASCLLDNEEDDYSLWELFVGGSVVVKYNGQKREYQNQAGKLRRKNNRQ